MRVGDKVTRYPVTIRDPHKDSNEDKKALSGVVRYIHPEGRYHMVEFRLPGGIVRECFTGT